MKASDVVLGPGVFVPGGGGRRMPAAPPSLDTSTLNHRPAAFACTHRRFAEHGEEVVGVFMGSERRPVGGGRKGKRAGPRLGRTSQSVRRSRSELRRRVLTLGATVMLTLTKRGKFESEADLWRVFKRFSRLMGKLYGARWRYVAVPELHSDGVSWHMHVAIDQFFWAGMVRRLWFRALGGRGNECGTATPGNIDLTAFRGRRVNSKVGRYLAKYLSKSVHARLGSGRLFAASSGLVPAVVARWRETFSLGLSAAERVKQRLFYDRTDVEVIHWHCGVVHGFTVRTLF